MSSSAVNYQQVATMDGDGQRRCGCKTESECSCGEENTRLTRDGRDFADGDPTSPGEDDLSLCDYHDLPPPPDGGYGWVVVFASFMCNMIVDGIAYTFGIFLQKFADHFHESPGTVSWVGSLLSGVYLSAGPIVSALTNKYGCRAVCIAGSIIGCAAFVLSTFSPNIKVLMLTYGVMGGLGFGLIYLPAVVCVGYYFETKRSLATGIAVCGSGVGTFAFAPLADKLLDMYGWQGANLILAGLILKCAVFGALMRPLEFPKGPGVKPLLQRMAEEKRFQMERGSIGGSYFVVQLPDGSMEKRLKMPINIDPGVHSSFNLDQLVPGTPVNPLPTVPTLPTITEAKVQEAKDGANEMRPPDVPRGRKKSRVEDLKEEDEMLRRDLIKQEREHDRRVSTPEAPNPAGLQQSETAVPPRGIIPRNASQPAFSTHVQGLPKNGSVPFFDRIRKTSTGERFRPTLAAINNSRPNMTSNGDVRKSLHLRLSKSSLAGRANNNAEDMWSKTDVDTETCYTGSKLSIPGGALRARRELIRPMSRKDIFYSGSVTNLPEYQSQKSLAGYRQSVLSLSMYGQGGTGAVDEKPPPDLCPCLALPDSMKHALATMMDVSLLKDPVFMMIAISNVFGMAGLYVPFVYLVEVAKKANVGDNNASMLLSWIGIVNTVGRVLCGYVADFPQVNTLLMNNVCLVMATLSVAAVPFCESYFSFILVAIFFGISISGYISLTSIILVDLLGLDKLTNAFGLLILFRGVAATVGSPLAGMVYDATGTYDIPFYMAAGLFAVSTVTSFLAGPLKQWTASEELPPQLDALTPIDEDEEEEEEEEQEGIQITIPEIRETAPSPRTPNPPKEIKQIESVL
ncbi:monocarboxylate transporter 3 isoform X3 [Thrips palmi]|uniref:Monocarboxylate transporter 3 isoform X3 n=1 Tax=Thrips palmi TaxID=161013 RepID=A0A6P9A910_THRPL|nr:monocarboxylate transporter 3 isoform X3 [Thrips palmi]